MKLRDFTPDIYSISRPNVKINTNSDDITGLINEFSDVKNNNLGKVKGYKATIILRDDAIPVMFRPRPVPFALRKAADQELDRLIKADIIEPVDPITTQINWASPCVYVPKSTVDSVRPCGDFKVTINPYIVYMQHPLPRFEELMSTFNNFSEYSCMDLRDAYMQLGVDETSRQYLVMSTHRGFFRYKRLCFGVCSAPSLFQSYMDRIFSGLGGVACFLDDIGTGGRTRAEHLARLRATFTRLRQAHMTTQLTKLRPLVPEIRYVGRMIGSRGIHPLPGNVAAIQHMATPTNISELRSFLGAINFYGNFIINLQQHCAPLHDLLRNNTKWSWTPQHDVIFKKLKNVISTDDT